jgi:hypothetical protein
MSDQGVGDDNIQLATSRGDEAPLTEASESDLRQELLKTLRDKSDWNVRHAIASNPNTPAEVLFAALKDPSLVMSVASNSGAEPALLRQLATIAMRRRDRPIEEALIANPSCPADVQDKLREVRSRDFIKAEEPATPVMAEVIDWQALAESPEVGRRLELARHEKLPKYFLELLVQDSDDTVRITVAGRDDISAKQLAVLASDPCVQVRMNVAKAERLNSDSATRLAGDADPEVRLAIASRTSIPRKAQPLLLSDPDIRVRLAAIGSRSLPDNQRIKEARRLVSELDKNARRRLALRRDLPGYVQWTLAEHDDPETVDGLTRNGWVMAAVSDFATRRMLRFEARPN